MTAPEPGWDYRERGSGRGAGYLQHITTGPAPASVPRPLDTDAMRACAANARDLTGPLPDADMRAMEQLLRGHLVLLLSDVQTMVDKGPAGDPTVEVAREALTDVRSTLRIPDLRGPWGWYRISRMYARRITALCSHHDSLNHP